MTNVVNHNQEKLFLEFWTERELLLPVSVISSFRLKLIWSFKGSQETTDKESQSRILS